MIDWTNEVSYVVCNILILKYYLYSTYYLSKILSILVIFLHGYSYYYAVATGIDARNGIISSLGSDIINLCPL